ncbi:MAG: hypothetical protein ACFFDT_06975 [Candidatus Hodarchaeota archaeon]
MRPSVNHTTSFYLTFHKWILTAKWGDFIDSSSDFQAIEIILDILSRINISKVRLTLFHRSSISIVSKRDRANDSQEVQQN